jgi:hypothetical protein
VIQLTIRNHWDGEFYCLGLGVSRSLRGSGCSLGSQHNTRPALLSGSKKRKPEPILSLVDTYDWKG